MGSPPPTEQQLLRILNMSQEIWGARVTENGSRMWFLKTTAHHPVKYRCDKAARELIARGWAEKVGGLSALRPTDVGNKELDKAGLLRPAATEGT